MWLSRLPLQRVRNLLALEQARENGRAVPTFRFLEEAERAGLSRQESEAALFRMEQEGLAHETPEGWRLRAPAVRSRIVPDHAQQVRLHR